MMIDAVKTDKNQQESQDVFQWCDRWCDRCSQTGLCGLYQRSSSATTEEILEELPKFFETAMKALKESIERMSLDPETLTESNFEDEWGWKCHLLRNDERVALAKKYRKMTSRWFDSLKDDYSTELRMENPALTECLDVILWFKHLLEYIIKRALISKNEEEEENVEPRDSIGNAKLLLVSIDRIINAWGYVYEKFAENEDEILDILICLQSLGKKIEGAFPDARAFVRPGLDE